MNLKTNLHVLFNVMKKILLTTLAMVLPFLAISCADYGTYGYGTVSNPVRSSGSSVFVGGAMAPLQVGFIATSFDRWAWDPYRRHYFDRSCRRYWNPRIRGYCSVAPSRFSAPIYPTGFRRGNRLTCPTYLPRHLVVAGHRGHSHRSGGIVSNRGTYAPVVHGQSRGVVSIRPSSYSTSKRSSSSSSRSGISSSLNQTTSSRGSSSQSIQRPSSSSRYQTISSSPSRPKTTPVLRSSSTSRSSSSPSQASSSSRSSSSPSPRRSSSKITSSRSSSTPSRSSRTTSSPSRSVSRARQKTR